MEEVKKKEMEWLINIDKSTKIKKKMPCIELLSDNYFSKSYQIYQIYKFLF